MEPIRTRPATTGDVDRLLEFWSRAGENADRPVDNRDGVERLIAHDPGALIVAESEGRIVATVIAGWDGWRANLYRLAVDPQWRGQGVGRRMLAAAEDRLRALGAERFCAMVRADNLLGQALWSSANYARQDHWRRWVRAAE